jgi:hypothetical protein
MSLMMVMVGVTEMAAAVVDAEAEVAAEAAAEVAVDVDTTMAAGVTSEDAMATTIGMVEIMDVEEETPTTAENPATDSTTPGITTGPGTTIGPGTTPTRQEERTTAAAEVTHTIVTTPETEEDIRTEEVTSTGLRPPETTTPLIITVAAVAVEIPTIATSLPVTGTTTEVEAATTVPRLLVTRRSSARGAAREIAAVVETMERTLRRPDTRHLESSLSHCDCLLVMTYWIH